MEGFVVVTFSFHTSNGMRRSDDFLTKIGSLGIGLWGGSGGRVKAEDLSISSKALFLSILLLLVLLGLWSWVLTIANGVFLGFNLRFGILLPTLYLHFLDRQAFLC